MRSSWDSSPSSSASNSSAEDNYHDELAPTQLLSLAIKKRRSLYDSKDRDYRKELLHTGMIQSLCKFLGEGRALRRRSSRKRSRSSSKSQKRPAPSMNDLPKKYAISNDQLEGPDRFDQPTHSIEPKEPTMLELNGGDELQDEDAVVPTVKRPKYEQVFEGEPTEEEKEIIKEYVMEDFLTSLVSFYTPNEYYTQQGQQQSVEPIKDLYWCDTYADTIDLDIPSSDFHLLALCSY